MESQLPWRPCDPQGPDRCGVALIATQGSVGENFGQMRSPATPAIRRCRTYRSVRC